MRLNDLLAGIAVLDRSGPGDLFGPDPLRVDIQSLSSDSRHIGPQCLFIAVPGEAIDGRQFIGAALAAGAVAVLTVAYAASASALPVPAFPVPAFPVSVGIPVFFTDDIRRAVALVAARFYDFQPRVITAVTGTNGKTSTAVFTAQLWHSLGDAAASLGTLGGHAATPDGWHRPGSLTTPEPITLHALLADASHNGINHLCLEASSHGLDQERLLGVPVTAAAFTNLTRDHLDYHGDEERYFAAKCRLFSEILLPGGTAVINADSPYGSRLARLCRAKGHEVWTYGMTGQDITLLSRVPSSAGQSLELEVLGQKATVDLPLVGAFQAANALAALGLVLATGGDRGRALEAMGQLKAVPGRLECVGRRSSGGRRTSGGTVYVDYAHSPDALETVLSALRPHTSRRLICVFGAGGDRDRGKRPLMGKVAMRLADRVIVTDDNPRNEDPGRIRAEVMAGASNAEEIPDRRTAIRTAIAAAGPGDVVLIAGKGHETGQIIGTVTYPFDDRQEVLVAMGKAEEQRSAPQLWTASEIAAAVGVHTDATWTVTGVSIDSRTVNRGDLFIALVGPNHDGHHHVAQALAAGAAGAIVHAPVIGLLDDPRLISVTNTFAALEDLGRAARARFRGKVVAVTGSVGKTSTKEMLALTLGAIAPTHAAIGSLNNQWGVPLTLARMPADAAHAVIEMGMNHAGEITTLAALARPHVAVITAISHAHMEYFSSLAAIADAKAEIFSGTLADGTAVLPCDSNHYQRLATAAQNRGLRIINFGESMDADVRLVSAVFGASYTDVVARLADGSGLSYKISAVGHHWATNSLIPLAVAEALGDDPEACAAALAGMTPPAGRGQRHTVSLSHGTFTVIDDAYNANPDSVRAGLAVLGAATPGPGGRRIAVIGDMLELGPQGPALHAELADTVVACGIDVVHTAGPLSAHLREALPTQRRGLKATTALILAGLLRPEIRPGDVVLVKGSAGSRMGEVVEALLALAPLTVSTPSPSPTPPPLYKA